MDLAFVHSCSAISTGLQLNREHLAMLLQGWFSVPGRHQPNLVPHVW